MMTRFTYAVFCLVDNYFHYFASTWKFQFKWYILSSFSVKEDLLIDLDLPPSARLGSPTKKPTSAGNVSLLDEPIDVPELGGG